MLDSIRTAANDVTSRLQMLRLHRLAGHANASQSRSTRFRVHGWRWHHLGIVRDLTRLQHAGRAHAPKLCRTASPAGGSGSSGGDEAAARALRDDMYNALMYILRDNWDVHDRVERHLFLPWVSVATSTASPSRVDAAADQVALVSARRAQLARDADTLARCMDAWRTSSAGEARCQRDLRALLGDVRALRGHAHALFGASEAALIPHVLRHYSEREQLAFNKRVLRHISAREARISLVIFRDAVDRSHPVLATAQDLRDFQTSVPSAIRNIALPFWRSKFVKHKVRFLSQ